MDVSTDPEPPVAARRLLPVLSSKWVPIVLYCLAQDEARRFNELQRSLPDISRKMLAQTLRGLERDGFVKRTDYDEVPPHTDYRLTAEGHRIREPIRHLCLWAQEHEGFLSSVEQRRRAAGG